VYKGDGMGRRKRIRGKKMEEWGGGLGGEKGTPAIKTPVGSFLWSLAAAKF